MGVYRGQGSPVLDLGIWFPDKGPKPEKLPPGCVPIVCVCVGGWVRFPDPRLCVVIVSVSNCVPWLPPPAVTTC